MRQRVNACPECGTLRDGGDFTGAQYHHFATEHKLELAFQQVGNLLVKMSVFGQIGPGFGVRVSQGR